jgi:hypothetical protein
MKALRHESMHTREDSESSFYHLILITTCIRYALLRIMRPRCNEGLRR